MMGFDLGRRFLGWEGGFCFFGVDMELGGVSPIHRGFSPING